jgi:hypothetical protein
LLGLRPTGTIILSTATRGLPVEVRPLSRLSLIMLAKARSNSSSSPTGRSSRPPAPLRAARAPRQRRRGALRRRRGRDPGDDQPARPRHRRRHASVCLWAWDDHHHLAGRRGARTHPRGQGTLNAHEENRGKTVCMHTCSCNTCDTSACVCPCDLNSGMCVCVCVCVGTAGPVRGACAL